MKKKSPTAFFSDIGAPLKNYRWSWGAVGEDDSVVLRAWDDEIEERNSKDIVRLTNRAAYAGSNHPGWRERCRHVDALKKGATGNVVVCVAEKPTPTSRRIKSYDPALRPILSVVTLDGDEWAELGSRQSI